MIWAQKWKQLPVAKIKGKKRVLDGVLTVQKMKVLH